MKQVEVVRGGEVVGYAHSSDETPPNDKLFNFADKFVKECLELARKKNSDYATANDPFNNLRRGGPFGIVVRMDDKVSRLLNLTTPGNKQAVLDESINDTIKDLLNYCWLLAGLINEGKSK